MRLAAGVGDEMRAGSSGRVWAALRKPFERPARAERVEDVDDAGFPVGPAPRDLPPVRVPRQRVEDDWAPPVDNAAAPAPRRAFEDDWAPLADDVDRAPRPRRFYDDEAAQVYDAVQPATRSVTSNTSTDGGTAMHPHTVDASTPQERAQAWAKTAQAHRLDAAKRQEQAEEFRRQAEAISDKPGLADEADDLLAQARKLEEIAEERLGSAIAYDEAAAAHEAERIN